MSEPSYAQQVETAVAAIRQQTGYQPTIGLVLGSGLSQLAAAVEQPDIIPYDAIPNWPASTVPGHSGRLVIGHLQGQAVLVQQGRAHYYEGYTPQQITFPARVMHGLGIRIIIVTNAAGGINPDFNVGDLMLIRDHINMPGLAGHNPLFGPNDASIGPRFPDMTEPYDATLAELTRQTAAALDFSLREGVYAYVGGPSFETPAELRFLRAGGADAVGMSTVPTVVVARHAGLRVLGISTITNKANLDPEPGTVLSHDEVLAAGKQIVPRLTALLNGVLSAL